MAVVASCCSCACRGYVVRQDCRNTIMVTYVPSSPLGLNSSNSVGNHGEGGINNFLILGNLNWTVGSRNPVQIVGPCQVLLFSEQFRRRGTAP